MKRALILVLFLAACSSSSKPTAEPPSLRNAVEAYTRAFGQGNGRAAWVLVSARCKGAIDETDYRATVAAAGVKYAGLKVVKYEEAVDGSAATVTYTTSNPEASQRAQRWVLEGGAWRYDGC